MQRFITNKPVEVREHDGVKTISGYAAVFYRADDPGTEFELFDGFIERIAPGAFSDAMGRDDVRALFNHEPNLILGRNKAGTLRLSEDEVGLRYDIDLPDTQTGRDVAESISRGDVTGSSFAFSITDQERRTENGVDVREIRGVNLYDVGPVTYPAYESTSVSSRSGEISEEVDALKADREKREKQSREVMCRLRLLELGLT